MTEIDTDKLRALDEAAREPGLSMPGEPAWLIERDRRENARKQLAAALRDSLPAILAMAEENKRLREALERIERAGTFQPHREDPPAFDAYADIARRALGKEPS